MSLARRFVGRLYALALRAFPSAHRTAYRAEMLDAFERARVTRARDRGTWAATWFVAAACVDAVRAGLNERRRRRSTGATAAPLAWVRFVGRDLIGAVRSLAKARAFTLVTVLSLGIGMGIVIAILMVLRVLVGPPPGIRTDGLVELLIVPQGALRAQAGNSVIDTWSYPDFEDVRAADTGIDIAGWTTAEAVLRLPDGSSAERLDAMYVSANYFAIIGAPLSRGRGLADASRPDVQAGREGGSEVGTVVISHHLWQSRFAGAPDIIGRAIVVNGVPHIVTGVTSEGLRGHLALHRPGFDLWLPLLEHPRLTGSASLRLNRDEDWLRVIGRLSPASDLTRANGAVASIMTGLATQHSGSSALKSASVEPYFPLGARQRADGRLSRDMLFAGANLVLLVVCLNISGMVLVRSATRERELAVRLAIGASRGRLMQSQLAEAVVLATLGGVLGATVLFGTFHGLAWWFGASSDRETAQFQPDAWIVLWCAALCLVTSLVFGLLPAVRFSRPTLVSALKDESAGGGGRRVGRVQRWTAAVQAGIAVPFLVIGAVRLDQARTTSTADLGFAPAGLFALQVDAATAAAVRTRLERGPGVVSVAVANGLPLDSQGRLSGVAREGAPEIGRVHTTRVSPGYFETMGVRLIRGRPMTADDGSGAEPVVVISSALSARLFPDGDALGARLRLSLDSSSAPVDPRWTHTSMRAPAQTVTIVGVTADVVDAYLGARAQQVFVPLAQQPSTRVYVIARSAAPLAAMVDAFETATGDFLAEPRLIRSSVVAADDLVRKSRRELVVLAVLSGLVSAIVLLLAALGVFGVVGFMVATRTREIGIRIALGASRARVMGTVLVGAMRLVTPGVVLGLLIGILAVKEITWTSLGVIEPLVYTLAAATTLGVALVAGLPAARRASAVEPIVAMRAE